MKTTLLAAALLTTVVPAVAQSPNRTMNEPELTTCWYSDKGNLTGSQAAEGGARPGTAVKAAPSGDRAWSYTIPGHEPAMCPEKLPVSSSDNT
jgi:hypothetical protein